MLGSDTPFSIVLRRGIGRGLKTVRRERGGLTTLSALFGVMAVVQLLIVVGIGVVSVEHLLRAQTDAHVEILRGAQDKDIQNLYGQLRDLPYVQEVQYVTKEQAYEQERVRDPSLISFLEQFNLKNPFPDTLSVTLRNLSDYDAFAAFVQSPRFATIIDPTFLSKAGDQQREAAEKLRLTEIGQSVVLVFTVLMLGVLLVVLIELVRRRSIGRSEEIVVERLAGAQDAAILIPFATEGAVLLLIALILSAGCLIGFLCALPSLVPSLAQGSYVALSNEMQFMCVWILPIALAVEILAIPLLALFSAWIGMRPLLKSPKLHLTS